MKTLILVLALAAAFWPSCGTQPASHAEENHAAETAQRQRELYQQRAAAKLHDLDQQIDALDARVTRASEAERKRLAPQIAELDRQREAAHEKLKQLSSASEEAWADMKVGIDQALNDLEAAYKRADSHFD